MSPDPSDGPVAVIGDDGGAVTELVESVGLRVLAGPVVDADDATAIVAVGDDAVLELARAGCSTPLLPVAVGTGLESVAADGLQAALDHFLEGNFEIRDRPIVAVRVDSERIETALTDVMVVTSEPAHISEYGISTPQGHLSTFRADGVVVATPAGSGNYARRVGGPILGPDVDGLSVVPVGAFKTERNHWVVSLPRSAPAIEVTVEREDAPVSLLVEDRTVGSLEPKVPLTLEEDGTLTLLRVPESESAYATPDDRPSPKSPQRTAVSESPSREQLFPH